MNKEIIWESLKEPLRLVVLAVIPLLITYFTELGTEWALAAILVLRFVDKFLHNTAMAEPVKDRNEGIGGVTGLTGF
jgi:hypothetical protein